MPLTIGNKSSGQHCQLKHNACWHTWMMRSGIKLTCPCEAHIWKNGTFSGSIFLVLNQWNIIGLIMLYQILSFCKPLSSLISCYLLWSSFLSYLWLILAFSKSTPADPSDKVPHQNETQQTYLQSRPLRRSNCPWVTLLPSPFTSAQQPALRSSLHTSLAWTKLRNGDILSGPYKWGN